MLDETEHATVLTRTWEQILALYAIPGVQESSLMLQDQYGVAITPLLMTIVLSREGTGRWDTITCEASLGHALEWERAVTEPLRALRRNLKRLSFPHTEAPITTLKDSLQRAELEAEYITAHLLLARLTLPADDSSSPDPRGTALHNALLLLQRHGCPPVPETIEALSSILHAAFPSYPKETVRSDIQEYWQKSLASCR